MTNIVLDRPERRNALSYEMIRGLGEALDRAAADTSCRCVVIRSAGDHFCAGRELAEGADRSLGPVLAYDEAYTAIFRTLIELDKPSVAVVRGYAVAGGFTLAMACDFVLADESARFGALEMKNGFPAAVNLALLAKLAPPRVAIEWLLFGDLVPARRLYEHGLINRLAADSQELEQVQQAFLSAAASLDAEGVRLGKEAFRVASSSPLRDALSYGKTLNALLLASGKIEEGAKAFASRRQRARSKT